MTDRPVVLRSPLLSRLAGVSHGFFTRRGGVSEGVYHSLNVGLGSGDDTTRVIENRRRAAAAFGLEADRLATCFQIHSAHVEVATGPWGLDRPRADGVVTTRHGLLCGALAADCAPVLLADPHAGVVAAVHAGWRGALEGVIETAVASMSALGSVPGRMVAAVGPCIGPRSYEVGEEFVVRFVEKDPANVRFFAAGAVPGKRQFDLPAYALSRLAAAGVQAAEWVGHDTCGEEDDFFSNRRAVRRDEVDYGRLLSVIVLNG